MLSRKEKEILKSIHVASENDPRHPEFPPDDPKFPATPTRKIKIPRFSKVWLKDESENPTGTHKDRMAWEIVVAYRNFLLAKQSGQVQDELPSLSIISSGSAALAIQTQLRRTGLPKLKVLIDAHLDANIMSALKAAGCELYHTQLSRAPLHFTEILKLTDNPNGFDITSNEGFDPTTKFYDWLSYEIINHSPEYCFIPFGTGNLYENILNINKKEVSGSTHDPRFSGNVNVLRNCHFIGATTNNPRTHADKLYSPHLPFVHFDEQWIRFYRTAGFCGANSDAKLLEEDALEEAFQLATSQGIECEYSGIAGLAMLLQMQKKIPANAKILIVNTGKMKIGSDAASSLPKFWKRLKPKWLGDSK